MSLHYPVLVLQDLVFALNCKQTSTRLNYVTFWAFDKTRQTVLRITITANIFAIPQSNNVAHAEKDV